MTAEDAAWSLQRAVTLGKAPAFILAQLGFTQENAGARIKAIDGQTLVLQVAEAWAPPFVLSCLSANVAGVIEKAAALGHAAEDDLGNAWLRGGNRRVGSVGGGVLDPGRDRGAGRRPWRGSQAEAPGDPPRGRPGGPAADAAGGQRRHRPQPRRSPAPRRAGRAGLRRAVPGPRRAELHRAEPGNGGTGAPGGGAGGEVGDRLRRDRAAPHPRRLPDPPGPCCREASPAPWTRRRSTRTWTRRRG